MPILFVLFIILILSIILAVRSLKNLEKIEGVKTVKEELKKGKVIFQKDTVSSASVDSSSSSS